MQQQKSGNAGAVPGQAPGRMPDDSQWHVGPQPLNTPEELRAIRQAMREGKNPLVVTDVPRWEDEVGVERIINRRVVELEPLPTPAQVLAEQPPRRSSPTRATRSAPACTGRTTACS